MAMTSTNPSAALTAALRPAKTLSSNSVIAWVQNTIAQAKNRRALRKLNPHLLRDIGMTDGDIAVLNADPNPLRNNPTHFQQNR